MDCCSNELKLTGVLKKIGNFSPFEVWNTSKLKSTEYSSVWTCHMKYMIIHQKVIHKPLTAI